MYSKTTPSGCLPMNLAPSVPAAGLCYMSGNKPHAIYRFRDQHDGLLYIGRSNEAVRQANEHRLRKDWITSAVRIDLEWGPAEMVHEMERRAIESEHPRYKHSAQPRPGQSRSLGRDKCADRQRLGRHGGSRSHGSAGRQVGH